MPWCWNSLQEGAWKRHRFELDVGQNRNYVLLTVKEDKLGRMQTVPSHSTTNQINKPKLPIPKSYSTRGFNLCATHILAAISPATLHNFFGKHLLRVLRSPSRQIKWRVRSADSGLGPDANYSLAAGLGHARLHSHMSTLINQGIMSSRRHTRLLPRNP